MQTIGMTIQNTHTEYQSNHLQYYQYGMSTNVESQKDNFLILQIGRLGHVLVMDPLR